jgi:hypothetical protein
MLARAGSLQILLYLEAKFFEEPTANIKDRNLTKALKRGRI